MNFFDSLISEADSLIGNMQNNTYHVDKDLWKDIGYNQVILQRDTAFELEGTGFNLVTSSPMTDGIVVIGDDLQNISGKRKFIRVSFVQIENEEDEQKAYNLIKKIEYVKYHFFPEGYMIRTSSRSHNEAVRVSESAVKRGISFQKIGSLLINKYKEISAVKAVKVLFITDPSVDYGTFERLAQKNNRIAETLNHIMNSVKFDCDTCNLKSICDEVEGMKELHFKNASKKDS